jgi:hypothetical protein
MSLKRLWKVHYTYTIQLNLNTCAEDFCRMTEVIWR